MTDVELDERVTALEEDGGNANGNGKNISSNYRATGLPNKRMSFVVWSIVEVSLNKLALWSSVGVYDWTPEWAIIADNVLNNKFGFYPMIKKGYTGYLC